MGTNGAFDRPGTIDRFQVWWYGQSRAKRVNKILYVVAAIGVVGFINLANRDTTTPASGLSARLARPGLTAVVPTVSPTTDPPTTTTLPPPPPASSTAPVRTTATTARPATTTTAATARVAAPTTTVPGVVFNTVSGSVLPPISVAPTTTILRPTTTTAPTTTVPTLLPTTTAVANR